MAEGPITKNGIHPITGKSTVVLKEGVAGSAKPAPPAASQVAAAGAVAGDDGKKKAAVQEKSMAETFYPKKLGLRGAVED